MKKGFAPIYFLLIFTIIGGLAIAYYLGNLVNFMQESQESTAFITPQTSDSSQEASSQAENANWKMYESKDFPFTFKYPPNTNIVPTASVSTQFTLIYPNDELANPMNLTFDYRKENISLNEYAKKQLENSKNIGEEILINLAEEDVNGVAGLSFTSKDNQTSGITTKHTFLDSPKGGNILILSHVGAHEDLADKILSTFKFTE